MRNVEGPIIFDVHTRQVVRWLPPLPPFEPWIEASVQGWTPDGRSILISRHLSTTTSDLLVVDATTGAITLQVPTGAAMPAEATADPTGRYIAVAMFDGTLWILDAEDGHPLAPPLPANDGSVTLDARARFAPDGRLVVTNGSVLRAFTIDPAQWPARACREAGRTLTREEFEEVLPGRPYAPACA